MISISLAIFFGLSGVICLYLTAFNNKSTRHFLVFSGWLSLLGSLCFWVEFAGLEYGVVYGLTCPALSAWVVICYSSEHKQARKNRIKPRQVMRPRMKSVLVNTGYFLFLVPVLAICSTLISVAISYLTPAEEINQLALCIFILPILWGVIGVWFFTDKTKVRPLVVTLSLASISAAYLFF